MQTSVSGFVLANASIASRRGSETTGKAILRQVVFGALRKVVTALFWFSPQARAKRLNDNDYILMHIRCIPTCYLLDVSPVHRFVWILSVKYYV